ncbi:hypothetical protein GMD78_07275 [Ornithinibacillus sp. L9]|uniref:Uncharacterized protein n=1 Tax=Ornithinibacillus caprae TaxID=2678566 RepID=A0A6N8FF96_9BACI|nr:hypothetical protein [Ornithinibacillus caprae]MUK88193.1 hypothetical protein [Ornithinibacillus caprae]
MEKFYVIKRTIGKDEQFIVIDAMSLDEADAIFLVRHKGDKDAMKKGEEFLVFEANGELKFDENNRVELPIKGEMMIHKKLS